MVWKPKLDLLIQMAFKAGAGISFRINNRLAFPLFVCVARLDMQTAGAVTHFTALALDFFTRNRNSGMGGEAEFPCLFLVAEDAGVHSDIFGRDGPLGLEDLRRFGRRSFFVFGFGPDKGGGKRNQQKGNNQQKAKPKYPVAGSNCRAKIFEIFFGHSGPFIVGK